MKKYCSVCDKYYESNTKKCPNCEKRLKTVYSEEELKEIQKQNDDMTVIDTMLM